MSIILEQLGHPNNVKLCCSALYESQWAKILLGDSFHPGGLALTKRLGDLLHLSSNDHVLDVASGQGKSALFLAKQYGCQVTGIEYGATAVNESREAVAQENLEHLVFIQQGDAEALPFDDEQFDVVLCECAFCTFPHKKSAASEFYRVLKRNGRVGMSDLTRQGALPPELDTLMAWIACIADAQPVEVYQDYLIEAGLTITAVENHNKALADMVKEVQQKLLGVEIMVKLNKIKWPNADFSLAKSITKSAAQSVRQNKLGYSCIIGYKKQ